MWNQFNHQSYTLCSIAAAQESLLACAQPSICSGISSSSVGSMQMPISKPSPCTESHNEATDLRAIRFHCTQNSHWI